MKVLYSGLNDFLYDKKVLHCKFLFRQGKNPGLIFFCLFCFVLDLFLYDLFQIIYLILVLSPDSLFAAENRRKI